MAKPEQAYFDELEHLTEEALINSLVEEDKFGWSFLGLHYRRAGWRTVTNEGAPASVFLGEGHFNIGRSRRTNVIPRLIVQDAMAGIGTEFRMDFKSQQVSFHIVGLKDLESIPSRIWERGHQEEVRHGLSEPGEAELDRLVEEMRRGASGLYVLSAFKE